MSLGLVDGCDNPTCRKMAVDRVKVGHTADTVDYDMQLCAYCSETFIEEYREENPFAFIEKS